MPNRNTPYGTLNIQKSTLENLRLLKNVFEGSTGRSISFNDLLLCMMYDTLAQRPEIYSDYLKFVSEEDVAALKLVGEIPQIKKRSKEDLGYANVRIGGMNYQLKIHPGTVDKRTGKKREDYCHLPRPIGKNCSISRLKKEYNAVIKPTVNSRVLGYVSFRDSDGNPKRCPIFQGVDGREKYCLVDGVRVRYSEMRRKYVFNTEWTDSSLAFDSV